MEESTGIAEPTREQVNVEKDKVSELENETWRGRRASDAIRCMCCDDGMVRDELPRYNRVFAIAILVIGCLLSLFTLLLLGLPMAVIGAYMAVTSRPVWICRACGVVAERNGT